MSSGNNNNDEDDDDKEYPPPPPWDWQRILVVSIGSLIILTIIFLAVKFMIIDQPSFISDDPSSEWYNPRYRPSYEEGRSHELGVGGMYI